VLKRRYRLLPLLYALALEAHETGLPMVRPLFMHYDTPQSAGRDQFLLGDRVMVAPVLEKGAVQRKVWLPPGAWTHWLTGQALVGDRTVVVDAPLAMTPIFVREGTALFVAEPGRNADDTLRGPIALELYPPSAGTAGGGSLFLDDGESDPVARFVLDVTLGTDAQTLHIGLDRRVHTYVPVQRAIEVILPPPYRRLTVDGEPVAVRPSGGATAARPGAPLTAQLSLHAKEAIAG